MMFVVLLLAYMHTEPVIKNVPGEPNNPTHDLWNASPMVSQLSHKVRSVQVCYISYFEGLVPSISP